MVCRMVHNNIDPTEAGERFIQALAAAVRAETAARRISIAELSRRVSVEKGVMYRYMRGDREFPLSVLFDVADALGTTVDGVARDAYRRMPDDPAQATPSAPSAPAYPFRAEDVPEERKAAKKAPYNPRLEEDQPDPDPNGWGA
jgi:transcriptional regulator with XRE-family HTH domain